MIDKMIVGGIRINNIKIFFKFFFLISIFLFSMNVSAYHIFIGVKDLLPGYSSKVLFLDQKDGNKTIKVLFVKDYTIPTKDDFKFLNKIKGKVIKSENKLYAEILRLADLRFKAMDYLDGFYYLKKKEQSKSKYNINAKIKEESSEGIMKILKDLAK